MSTNESIYIYREIITDKKKINIIFLIVVENINKIKHSDVYYLFFSSGVGTTSSSNILGNDFLELKIPFKLFYICQGK